MSRIGTRKIEYSPSQVSLVNNIMKITGTLGSKELIFPSFFTIEQSEKTISLSVLNSNDNHQKAMWGTMNAILKNTVIGVSKGFSKLVRAEGKGYAIDVNGKEIMLKLGYSEPKKLTLPEGVTAEKKTPIEIELKSHDKELLHQTVEKILRIRKVDSFTAKGLYKDNKGVFNVKPRKKPKSKK
jgi:large subunit ribosomal protein L6